MPLNYLKTALLLGVLTAIFVALGGFVGGQGGLAVAFVVALVMNLFAYWKSDQMVLRLQGAIEVDRQSGGQYYAIVQQLSQRAGLPMPRVYVMQAPQPNAFATGRNPRHAAICATTGLLDLLNPEEIAGVIGHELSHVKNRDTLTMTIAATIGGAISMIANWLQIAMIFGNRSGRSRSADFVAMLLAPFAAMIVQLAISRSREYQADRLGAQLCGNPAGLASALVKIQDAVQRIPNPAAGRVPAMAQLYIINPLGRRWIDVLFASHPSTESRVAELRRLAAEMGVAFELDSTRGGPAIAQAPNGRPHGTWS